MSVPFLITLYDICVYLVRVLPVHECRNIGTHVRYYDIPNPTSGLLSVCSPRWAQEGVWDPLASLGPSSEGSLFSSTSQLSVKSNLCLEFIHRLLP